MNFAESKLRAVVIIVELNSLGVEVVGLLVVLLDMLYLPLDVVEVTPQELHLLPVGGIILLVGVGLLQVLDHG